MYLIFKLNMVESLVKGLLLAALVINFKPGFCQTPSKGAKCPEHSPTHSIDMKQLTGQWYEIEASPLFAEWMFHCVSIKVSAFYEMASQIRVEAINQNSDKTDMETVLLLNASVSHTTNGNDGIISVKMIPGTAASLFEVGHYVSDLHVLDTDYKNWVLIWSCRSYKKADARAELLWILSRQRTLEKEYYQAVKASIAKYNLETIMTMESIQTDCSPGESDGMKNNMMRE